MLSCNPLISLNSYSCYETHFTETLTGEKTSVDQFCQNYPKECWLNQIINKHQGYNRLFPAKIFAWAVGGG
nr:hypothetical protein BaRGS_011458 [Batillaria attramentaria]